jgi:hypothetical protein
MRIMSPVGATGSTPGAQARQSRPARAKPVIGLLDNSKPNVALFVQALEHGLRERGGDYEIVTVAKPRSAMPLPELDALAERCDYVVNAVAD